MKYFITSRQNPITKTSKFYAQLAPVTPVFLDQIARDISRECTVTPADTKAVLSALQDHIIRLLAGGNSVRLGDLGSFHPTLAGIGTERKEDYNANMIKAVRVRFTPSKMMRYELSVKNPHVFFEADTAKNGSAPQPPENV